MSKIGKVIGCAIFLCNLSADPWLTSFYYRDWEERMVVPMVYTASFIKPFRSCSVQVMYILVL